MFFEQAQEILITELLAPFPGVPSQIGACVDASSGLATAVVARSAVPLRSTADLAALAARADDPARAALRLSRSAASLFRFLAEERFLRLEDLHWAAFDLKGNGARGVEGSPAFSQISFVFPSSLLMCVFPRQCAPTSATWRATRTRPTTCPSLRWIRRTPTRV